ncbi:hypothetical protein HPB49_008496 [Dermacentor silvarum]|uniref:Uncharacterized protein n=1 Tax=Dermacentor silvarum TaxID=543639 RepID=A0ACB8DBT2_DERSI|nr:hypothetical protein HPB49_008496 [Dermacentor silvarum]
MDADEYVVIIKPRETCNLTQYRGTGSIGNAIRAAISQRSDNAEADPNLAHKYSLHPIWEQNLVVVGTKEELVLPILLGLDKLRLTDRTINVQAYLKAKDNMGKGVIRLVNTFTTDYILENTTSPHNQIIGARRLGSTNVVALTFEHSNLPRCVFFLNEATLVQKYRKTNAICATCGKPEHRTDVCPAPVPGNERCALCGKTGVDASQQLECHPRSVLCGGAHVAGSHDCPRRYRQPAPSKPANPPADQTRGRSRTPTLHHNGQRYITSVAGKETRERSTSRDMPPASSETPEPDTHITQRRNSLTTPTQTSIVDMVDKALEQKLSAFTATITQTIEQSIMKHVTGRTTLEALGINPPTQVASKRSLPPEWQQDIITRALPRNMHPVHHENRRAARAKAYDKYSDHAAAFFVDAAGPLHNRSTATVVHRGQVPLPFRLDHSPQRVC